ncbi:MAG: hypothetical protein M1827_000987 [Pycnora praestabilis]|nr:MAG: hypothetical protein M1827_000987 [Pycnora praestabilis]
MAGIDNQSKPPSTSMLVLNRFAHVLHARRMAALDTLSIGIRGRLAKLASRTVVKNCLLLQMDSKGSDQSQALTAEALVDLEVPKNVRVSPSGRQVVYSLSPGSLSPTREKGKHPVSSIWIADVRKESSARQLTSGSFNDTLPQWSRDGESIAFLSDRGKQGESSAIYMLSMKGGEAYAITNANNKKSIGSFSWSPNGISIAFLSADEKTAEQETQEKNGDDVKVYGEHWEYSRLRCIHVPTREVSTLVAQDAHVQAFAWSEDSNEIAYFLHETPDINSSGYKGVKFERISLSSKSITKVCDFPGVARHIIWSEADIFFIAGATPGASNSSATVYKISLESKTWSNHLYGVENCAVELRRTCNGVAVRVQSGLRDQIHLLNKSCIFNQPHEISTWDVIFTEEGTVIAIGKSSGSSPTEIYSVTGDNDMHQLSQHGSAIAALNIGNAQPFYCTATDGTELDGVFITPVSTSTQDKPYKTIVLIHGGPYWRSTIGFDLPHYNWTPYLVSAGYAVLCPNYRGNSSRGEAFAAAARGGMGTTDYSDVIDSVKAGIGKGLIDENNVAIGGFSQGGFLSYLAVTRPDFVFKAAVCGAGVSDFDMMSMTSDAPFFEAELAGKAPWEVDADSTEGRHGSAIWNMKAVKTPILILHGEEDARVPLTQGVAFHRGCLHHGVPCEMVRYPREPHVIAERKHLVDMLKRIRRFYDSHLG